MAKEQREVEKWITVNGKHIPVFKGESTNDAYNRVVAKDNEDIKQKQIAKRKEETDKLNGKSLRQKNAEALGLDYNKLNADLIKEYESNQAEYSKSSGNKKAELAKWLERNKKSYEEAKSKANDNGKSNSVYDKIGEIKSKPTGTLARAEKYDVKVSPNSWTLRDKSTNAPKGTIRDIKSLKSLQTKQLFDVTSQLKSLGLSHSEIMDNLDNLFVFGKTPVFMLNTQYFDHHDKHGFFSDSEKDKYNNKVDFIKKLNDKGITIVSTRKLG